jgi:acetyltransferase-like isoleucine patch superfamily enzyme
MGKRLQVRRFLPGFLATLYYYAKYRAFVSPKAEVELTPLFTLGIASSISSFTKIKATDGPLEIGKRVQIGCFSVLTAGSCGITIGDDCLISPNVSIIGDNYRYDRIDQTFIEQGRTSKGICIANNVWLGSGARILDGAVVGSGAIVTPNSVVSGRVPENAIFQGNPAKVIFTRR